MWCKHCGQDVPAFSSSSTSVARCARCGGTADEEAQAARPLQTSAGSGVPELSSLPPGVESLPSFEDWDIEQSFRQLQARLGISTAPKRPPSDQVMRRIDAAHASLAGRHVRPAPPPAVSSIVAWTLLTIGLMAFSCGASLMGWSIAGDRPELWSVGLPMAAAGQLGLVVGLVVQFERSWRKSRRALDKLAEVDEQLNTLEQTTRLLGLTHGTASQAFYAHMAEQANPHLLLADLKGQLDLLSANLSQR